MDKNEALAIANNYISIVSKQIPVQSAFLFGSYAKGNNHESSDIDIALVFDQVEDIFDLQVKLMQIRWDDVLMIEPHPFRLTDFSPSNPIVAEISKYGIPLTLVAAWRSGKIEEDYGFCAIHNHFNTMQYNELSQLETKYLHGDATNALQQQSYAYNIRGWLTHPARDSIED